LVFKTGTTTIGGLSGISLEVGPKAAQGGGSLIFYWHGTGSTAGEYKFMMPAAVTKEIVGAGGIIVSFQSSLRTGGDCSGTATFSKGDFGVADLIAACAVRDHNIDPRRIYTTGCSAGGLQAGCMAQLRSNYIAAAVPNSGGTVFPQTFQSKTHVPAAMTMHGGASDQVVVSFSQTSATFDKSMKAAGGFVINCNHGGGHCGAPAPLYTAGWQFMKDHPFGTEPSPYESSLPSSFPSYCAKY
jgi:poly(3-hydroxybutyrate) depolymerase